MIWSVIRLNRIPKFAVTADFPWCYIRLFAFSHVVDSKPSMTSARRPLILCNFPQYFKIVSKPFGNIIQLTYWNLVYIGPKRNLSDVGVFTCMYPILPNTLLDNLRADMSCETEACSYLVPKCIVSIMSMYSFAFHRNWRSLVKCALWYIST